MGFTCCICLTSMSDKSSDPHNVLMTTKCGHLFHNDCLNQWFDKKGTKVWTTRECPVCSMNLNAVTDLIRIFTSPDDSPNTEDYQNAILKLKRDNGELSRRLEVSFLQARDTEKAFAILQKENEFLKAGVSHHHKHLQNELHKLKNENDDLKNVVVKLSKSIADGRSNLVSYNANGAPVSIKFRSNHQTIYEDGPGTSEPLETDAGMTNSRDMKTTNTNSFAENDKLALLFGMNNISTGNSKINHTRGHMENDANDNDGNNERDELDDWIDQHASSQVKKPTATLKSFDKDNSDTSWMKNKVYGKYVCPTCNAEWGSSRTIKNKPQICLCCNTPVTAYEEVPLMTKAELRASKLASYKQYE